jgi:hypothetical protein
MRTLVIYVLHEINKNVEYFLKNGIFKKHLTDFYIIINSLTVRLVHPDATIINRENIGHDFGGWSYCLFQKIDGKYLHELYDNFLFINSTVRGPFLPEWCYDNWIDLFLNKITNVDKLIGTTVGSYQGFSHIQSMMFCTDRIGLDILINSNIFTPIIRPMNKVDVIFSKEIGMSSKILAANYNISCMLTKFRGCDFRTYKHSKDLNIFANDSYFGIEVHPYEVIFIKYPAANHTSLINTIERLTEWKNNQVITQRDMDRSFDWKDYLKANKDVFWADNSEEYSRLHYVSHGAKEGRRLRLTPLKHWEVYVTLNPDIVPTYLGKDMIRSHYTSFGINENRKTNITGFNPDNFNWIYYKNVNSLPYIKTRMQGINHYITQGIKNNLKYTPDPPTKYYLIDLNPLSTSGLFNQIISLVNGILIGYSLNRNIVVSGFYPDYNAQNKIKLSEIINMTHLNNLLKIEDINITVLDQAPSPNITWARGPNFNPTKKQYLNGNPDWCFTKMAEELYQEQDVYVDMGDTFTFFLFRHNPDEWLSGLFVRLLIGIKYSPNILSIVSKCNHILQLKSNYSSIHLRLEDDFLFHRPDKSVPEIVYGEMIKNKYLDVIPRYFSQSEDIYLCTFLLKKQNQYNFFPNYLKNKYQGMKFWKNPDFYWRNSITVARGREIDALIDYLICLGSSKFLGYNGSTFSEVVKYYFDDCGKSAILI